MLLQNIRARISARLSGDREAGFTLIELLVVMLILGILAAIALPAFFNQRDKAGDAKAKEYAHSAQVAMETYATDNEGKYTGADDAALQAIEPSLNSVEDAFVTSAEDKAYTITITSSTGNTFLVENDEGTLSFPCTVANEDNRGGCPSTGVWDGSAGTGGEGE